MIAGLILAGGQGLRLGGVDKAFVALNGRPLLAHVIERLGPQVGALAISANGDASRFSRFGLPVLADHFEGCGPLAGIAAGLVWAQGLGAAWLASLPVDTPFAPVGFVSQLSPGPSVASFGGRQHYLVALWPIDFLPRLQLCLTTPGLHKVRDALALISARQVAFATQPDPFLNINTPADLIAASQRED